MEWPKHLVRQITTRRVIFFLGSGVSAGSKTAKGKKPLTWTEFIRDAKKLLANDTDKELVDSYLSRHQMLLALEVIKKQSNVVDYKEFLDSEYVREKYEPSDVHNLIYKLDSRIVITTNFDKIYENLCTSNGGYKVITYYSGDLVSEIRSDNRLILKAHGTIDEVNKMVFTMSNYHDAKRDHPNFYEVLKALFLTSTIVFIGCRMEDPDVLLMLEEVKNVSKNLVPHYVLSKKDAYNSIEKGTFEKSYGFNIIEYGSEYSDLTLALEQLWAEVFEQRSQPE